MLERLSSCRLTTNNVHRTDQTIINQTEHFITAANFHLNPKGSRLNRTLTSRCDAKPCKCTRR